MRDRIRFCRIVLLGAIAILAGTFAGSARGYLLEGPRWSTSTIPMRVQLGSPGFVLPDGFLSWNSDAENALAQWNEQLGGVKFTWTEAAPGTAASSGDHINSVSMASSDFGKSFGKGVLAITTYLSSGSFFSEADVVFNSNVGFSSGRNAGPGKDLHRVALHEFGHVLGLDHPNQAKPPQMVAAIMNSTVTTLNHLADDDVQGVVFLYGAPPNPPPLTGNARFANISTRADVGTGDNVEIVGFITKTQTKQILLRGLGPSIGGVSGRLADPTMDLHNSSGSSIFSNDNWKDTQQTQIQQTGIPPPNDLESAIYITLAPGGYSAILSGKNGGTGIGQVEAYDLALYPGKTANISTRGFVSTGDNVMIAGFIIQGPQLQDVVMRGIGPGLNGQVAGPLPDTTIELHNANGVLIQSNTGWRTDSVSSSFVQSYNLAPKNDKDSALYNQLAPGGYSLILKSPTNASGIGLVEVYDVSQ